MEYRLQAVWFVVPPSGGTGSEREDRLKAVLRTGDGILRRVRVVHVMEATIGGTRRHLVDLARGQARAGLEVHLAVATVRDPGFPADLEALEREGVGVARLPMVREIAPVRDLAAVRALAGLLKRLRPEIVHTHSSKGGALGRLASIATGVGARVHTPHTFAFLFSSMFGPAKRRLYRSIELLLGRATARTIAVSSSEAETFLRSGVVAAERIRVVPNGVDPARFLDAAPLALESLGLDRSRPVAAVIGLVYSGKGQDLALQCLVRPGCEALQLLIVGPGDTRPLEALAHELGVAERVRFLGPRSDVPALLAAIDFLILPSRWEGMPYIVLEAMASARAVAATPVDGARDLVVHGATGRIAERIDAEALALEVSALLALSPADRAAMGAAGRARVLQSYRVEDMVERTISVYDEVACGSST